MLISAVLLLILRWILKMALVFVELMLFESISKSLPAVLCHLKPFWAISNRLKLSFKSFLGVHLHLEGIAEKILRKVLDLEYVNIVTLDLLSHRRQGEQNDYVQQKWAATLCQVISKLRLSPAQFFTRYIPKFIHEKFQWVIDRNSTLMDNFQRILWHSIIGTYKEV